MRNFARLILAAWLASIIPVGAMTYNSSGVYTNVEALCLAASPGDTVTIPAGTFQWTNAVDLTGITLQGAGTNLTSIDDQTPYNGNEFPVFMHTVSGHLTRVTGIRFFSSTHTSSQNFYGEIAVRNGYSYRVDHCFFDHPPNVCVGVSDYSYGVIDHCTFLTTNQPDTIKITGAPYGDLIWSFDPAYGSTNTSYMESCYAKSDSFFTAIDSAGGGSYVCRSNVLIDFFCSTHGLETGGRLRGSRYVEVYGNYADLLNCPQQLFFDARGGTALVFNNILTNCGIAKIQTFRTTDNDPAFAPFYGATGASGWDSNSASLLTFTASSSSTSNLIVSGAGWTINQWVGDEVFNTNSIGVWNGVTNNGNCGTISSNSSDTMYFYASRAPGYQIGFTAGDVLHVHDIVPMDGIGVGTGDLLVGDNPSPTYLHQVRDPQYYWSNNVNGVMVEIKQGDSYGWARLGREFIAGIKPGYTPLVYPHPLDVPDAGGGIITNTGTLFNLGRISSIIKQ
jgi:hypothetical protein